MTMDEQLVALARLQLAGCSSSTHAPIGGLTRPVSERPLMTVTEVAAFFSKTDQAVYKMVERGQLPGVTRVGRRLYVRRSDLLRSIAEGRVPSPGRNR